MLIAAVFALTVRSILLVVSKCFLDNSRGNKMGVMIYPALRTLKMLYLVIHTLESAL